MAINKNHEFEELDGVKCSIVEKNVSQQRLEFLKDLLEFNNYKVVFVASPPPKVVAVPAATVVTAEVIEDAAPPAPPPATYTVGVTDVSFNPTNAIFGRLLKTKDRRVVTLAFWQQKEAVSNDEIPYFDKKL